MNWLDRRRLDESYKNLPIQSAEADSESRSDPESKSKFSFAYGTIEAVGRGCDLVTDLASEVKFDVKKRFPLVTPKRDVSSKRLNIMLNIVPSDDEDMSVFIRKIILDIILTGNAFIYFDGHNLFRIPSEEMSVVAGKKSKIAHYEYRNTNKKFTIKEIIHIQDNATSTKLTGTSRLKSATNSIDTLYKMLAFQKNFFKNGAVPGLVLTTPNILGKKIKERLIEYWTKNYSPAKGGKRPLILDGDFKVQSVSTSTFKELDFESSVDNHENKILNAIGVPPILLKGGNNANVRPNMQLLYFTTVLPIMNKILAAFEAFFGYDLALNTSNISSLQPELREQASFQATLVNGGIITPNEARANLRYDPIVDEEADKLRIPANIAGSASDPSQGGKPPGGNSEN